MRPPNHGRRRSAPRRPSPHRDATTNTNATTHEVHQRPEFAPRHGVHRVQPYRTHEQVRVGERQIGPGLTLMTTVHAFASNEYSLVLEPPTGSSAQLHRTPPPLAPPSPAGRSLVTTGRPGDRGRGLTGRPGGRSSAPEPAKGSRVTTFCPGSSDASKLALLSDLTAVRQISQELYGVAADSLVRSPPSAGGASADIARASPAT